MPGGGRWATAGAAASTVEAAAAAARKRRRIMKAPWAGSILDSDQRGVDSVLGEGRPDAIDFIQLCKRAEANPVPDSPVGQVRRLHARDQPGEREARLQVVGVGRVLERAGLDEIEILGRTRLVGRLRRRAQ